MNLHFGPICRSLLRNKGRSFLALSMTVLTFAVVVNCFQLIRDQQAKLDRRSGVDDDHLVYLTVDNFDSSVTAQPAVHDRIRADLTLLRNFPGVTDALSTRFMPWRGGGSSGSFRPYGSKADKIQAQYYAAGPHLAHTLGIDISGKPLTVDEMNDADVGNSVKNSAGIIVTRKLADALFPAGDAIGQLVEFGANVGRVDGIIDQRLYNPYAWDIGELIVFYPGFQGDENGTSFLVRVDDQLLGNLAQLEATLLAAHTQRSIRIDTITETRRQYNAGAGLTIDSLTMVIALMIFVSGVSIIGLTSSAVAARRREIGTRRALGATSAAILRHFLLENGVLTLVGLILGLGLAYALNLLLVTQMGAPKLAVPWLAIAALLIATANIAAAAHPATRASRIPPALATKAA